MAGTGARAKGRVAKGGAMKGVILAGGTATRLFPLTTVTNKHLLPVYNSPMIYYPITTLAEMGITEILVILGGKSVGDIVELLGDGSEFGVDFTYRYQKYPLGIAQAISLAKDFVGKDPFCVVLGDNILYGDNLQQFAKQFVASRYLAGAVLYDVKDPERFGVAEFDPIGRLLRFHEKPKNPMSNSIPIGVYFFRPDVFSTVKLLRPSERGEFEVTDVLNHYLEQGKLAATKFTGIWTDAGTVESLNEASNLIKERI